MPDRRSLAVAAGQAVTTAACAGLNLLTPLPRGTARTTLRYGPHPRHRLDLYRPARAAPGAGLVVFVYGGAWATGRRRDYRFAAASFLRMGWSVAVPDYRLLPVGVFPAFLEDAAAATARALGAGAAANAPLVLAGHSAGAYSAAMLALDARWLAAAGVPERRVSGLIGLSGPYDFLPLDHPATIAVFSRVADLPATQPVCHVGAGKPPALLVHADNDYVCGVYHSRNLWRRLVQFGSRADILRLPAGGHLAPLLALSRPWRNEAVTDAIGALLDTASGASSPVRIQTGACPQDRDTEESPAC